MNANRTIVSEELADQSSQPIGFGGCEEIHDIVYCTRSEVLGLLNFYHREAA